MPTVSSQSDYLRQSVRTTSRKQDGTDFGKRLSRRFRPWPKIGHLQSERAVTFGRNDRSRSIGISGQIGPEYAVMFILDAPAGLSGCRHFHFGTADAAPKWKCRQPLK